MTPQSAADAAPISITLTAVFEPAEEGWILATLPAVPGVVTQGRSLEEARFMLADAVREYLLALDDARAPSGKRRDGRPARLDDRLRAVVSGVTARQ
jgi:predicted RNase H-like HicB family nuclease